MLTDEEAEKLKRKLALERARYLEDAEREARGRQAAQAGARSQQKAKRRQNAQRKAAASIAKAAGKDPKPIKRSVFAVRGGAVETNRRKF